MANVMAVGRLFLHDGKKYDAGDKIDLDAEGLNGSTADNLVSIGVLVKPETSKSKAGDERISAITNVIRSMLADDPKKANEGWWTGSGLPSAGEGRELEKRFGGEITADERTQAFNLLKKG